MTRARKGWCPGALRPMMSGDGLIVRVRAPGAALSCETLAALARLSARHGSGVIELTQRAGLQLRGVREAEHGALVASLGALGLVDPEADRDPPTAVTLSPFTGLDGDETGPRLLAALERGVADRPALSALPPKFGFVLDAGPAPVLRATSGDVRIERSAEGGLAVVCDGADGGYAATEETAAPVALALAEAFAVHPLVVRGEARRMAALAARVDLAPNLRRVARAAAAEPPAPGPLPQGALAGWPFGRLPAATVESLARRAADAGAAGFRTTPWRALLALGAPGPLMEALGSLDLVLSPADGRRFVDVCVGAPFCASAGIATDELAKAAASVAAADRRVHVSGCAKGCANPGPVDLALVGRDGLVDAVRRGATGDPPSVMGLAPSEAARRIPELVGEAP